MSVRLIRIVLAALAAVVTTTLVLASPASAVAAKFHSATGTVSGSGALVVSFDERGVGNGNIDYSLTANATAVYACINGGGKHPKAANKETVSAEVTASGSFESKNGRVVASLSTGPNSAGDFTCPPGQRLVLAGVSYTDIVLTDTTNGSSVTVDDVSRTFFAV
jgi:hypothetical protein